MKAKVITDRWLVVATLVAVAGLTGLSLAQEKKPEPPKPADTPKTVVDVAKESKEHKTFVKLVEMAGLVDTLKGAGPFTVFAPTDQAFAKLGKDLEELQKPENKARLARILKHHVLAGSHDAAYIKSIKTAKTVAGTEITITVQENVVLIDDAKVTKADIKADNGLIHVIDTVLTIEE